MLTDYTLAAVTLLLAVSLFRLALLGQQISVWLWAAAFVATAVAAIFGGTSHGFALYLGEAAKTILWKATVYTTGLVSFFMLSGAIMASVPRPLRPWLLAATGLKFLLYGTWMVKHNDFRYVIYDYAPAMFGVLILQAIVAYGWRDESAGWIIAGILVSFVAAGIQQSRFKLHKNFNHNDLYHVVQTGAIYLLYKGGCLLKDW